MMITGIILRETYCGDRVFCKAVEIAKTIRKWDIYLYNLYLYNVTEDKTDNQN